MRSKYPFLGPIGIQGVDIAVRPDVYRAIRTDGGGGGNTISRLKLHLLDPRLAIDGIELVVP